MDAHEGTGEVIKFLDDDMFNFLSEAQSEGLLKDTTIMLISDHGLHMSGAFTVFDIEEVKMERSLPALFISMPKGH